MIKKRSPNLNKHLIASLGVVILGLVLSGVFASLAGLWYQKNEAVYQREYGDLLAVEIKTEILSSVEMLHALQSIIESTPNLSRESFDIFMSSSFMRFPTLRNVYWAPAIEKEENSPALSYEVAMEYSLNELSLLGQDLMANDEVRMLMELAQRSKRLLISPRAPYRGSEGVWALLPVIDSEGGSLKVLKGVLLAKFDFTDVFQRRLGSSDNKIAALVLKDITLPNWPQELYRYNVEKGWELPFTSNFSVAGRIFQVEYRVIASHQPILLSLYVAFLGVLITALFSYVLYMRLRSFDHISLEIRNQTEELHGKNRLYRTYLNMASEGFLSLDEAGVIIRCNEKAEEIFANSAKKCLGRHIRELISPSSFARIFEEKIEGQYCAPHKINEGVECEGLRPNGLVFPLLVKVVEAFDIEGVKWLFVCEDLTAKEQLKDRLRSSERQFRQAFSYGATPMVILDNEGYVQDCNKSYYRFTGYTPNDVLGQRIRSFMHPNVVDGFMDWIEEAHSHIRENYQVEQRLIHLGGHQLWVEASYTAVYDFVGKLKNVICQFHDFTQRKAAEDELKIHRDRLAQLVEERTREAQGARENLIASINAADNAILVYDNQDNLQFASDLVAEFFPEMADELKPGISARRLGELLSLQTNETPEQREDRLRLMHEGISGGEFKLNSGRWIQTLRRKTPSGGAVVVHTDVTKYKEQEELLRLQARDLAVALQNEQQINQQQKMFVSVVSHEFRTPLAIIDSAAQRILRHGSKLGEEELHARLSKIREAVQRLLSLIKSTLTIEKIETGKMDCCRQKMAITPYVRSLCVRQQELARNHEILLVGVLEDVEVMLDQDLFDLALTNLINNAEKYSPIGSQIKVSIDYNEAKDQVLVSVADEGIGIAKEEHDQVFTRFFRSSSVGEAEGTGIGLSIVKQIMTLHDGDVSFTSTQGVGSKFTLHLPL